MGAAFIIVLSYPNLKMYLCLRHISVIIQIRFDAAEVVAVNIKPSAAIRQNYTEIAELCRSSQEPVYLTENGEGDLVVMDIAAFTRREKMLKLREELLRVEEDRLHGAKDYTLEEVVAMMEDSVNEVYHAGA